MWPEIVKFRDDAFVKAMLPKERDSHSVWR